MAHDQPRQLEPSESATQSASRPTVVGLYGIPCSGIPFLLNQLDKELGRERFAVFEASRIISDVVPGGRDTYLSLSPQEQVHCRELAIDKVGQECEASGSVGVVDAHFMVWLEDEEVGHKVYTRLELSTFTNVIYIDVPPEVVALRCLEAKKRSLTVEHLRKWQQAEKTQLRKICRNHDTLFSLVTSTPTSSTLTLLNKVSSLLRDFRDRTEVCNTSHAERQLDEAVLDQQGRLKTVLVLDADKILAAEDTGVLFWKMLSEARGTNEENTLQDLFSSPLGYSFLAFRQAALLYEEAVEDDQNDHLCGKVASLVTIHPEFINLLRPVPGQSHVRAIVITCGLAHVWRKVLITAGLPDTVQVIGGERFSAGLVVTPSVKVALVSRLQDVHKKHVWAFGDIPLDMGMLKKVDQAIVVVGKEETRSRSMDAALKDAIDNESLRALQVLLPSHASPRLDTTRLPLIQLNSEFIDSIFRGRHRDGLQILHATERSAAKLLMTLMRDARNAGAFLGEPHRCVGWYLATEFLGAAIGLEEYEIPHVQGHITTGHRIFEERQTMIVAIMPGGQLMALGVSDAFRLATLVHARDPTNITVDHVREQSTIVLVDSVVNTGKSVVEFVQHIRSLSRSVRIVVIAGVV